MVYCLGFVTGAAAANGGTAEGGKGGLTVLAEGQVRTLRRLLNHLNPSSAFGRLYATSTKNGLHRVFVSTAYLNQHSCPPRLSLKSCTGKLHRNKYIGLHSLRLRKGYRTFAGQRE